MSHLKIAQFSHQCCSFIVERQRQLWKFNLWHAASLRRFVFHYRWLPTDNLFIYPVFLFFRRFFFCENKNKKCTISMSLTPHLYFILFRVSFMRADDIIDTHMGSVCSLQLNSNCAVCTRLKSLRKALWNWVNARNVCRSDLVAWKFRKVIRRLTRLPFLNYFVMKLSVACLVSLFGLTWH